MLDRMKSFRTWTAEHPVLCSIAFALVYSLPPLSGFISRPFRRASRDRRRRRRLPGDFRDDRIDVESLSSLNRLLVTERSAGADPARMTIG